MSRRGHRTCAVCTRQIITNSIHKRTLNYNVRIPDQFPALTCTSKNVAYVVKCKVHHKTYVGQTTSMLRARINRHLAMVKSFKCGIKMNMGHHFNGEDCSINNLVWTPVAEVDDLTMREAETELNKIETRWIRKMCSMQSWGMNYVEIDKQVRTNPFH